jgi:uncharacterized protein
VAFEWLSVAVDAALTCHKRYWRNPPSLSSPITYIEETIMSEQDNVGIVQQAYRNYQDGNVQGVLNLCDENIDWELPAMEGIPFSGKRRGRDQVGQFFTQLADAQEVLQFEPREFIAQGNKVVAFGHYAWSVRETDRNYESDWVHVFTVRDGKVAEFKEYTDTAAAGLAYQPREPQ